ncbi:MAG: copper resistance system multicopper oxidase [Acidiferrobacterales bacterium]
MKRIPQLPYDLPEPPRRRFMQGLAAGGILLGLSPWLKTAGAGETTAMSTGTAAVLSGTEFNLTIAETPVDFTGRSRRATTINGSLPGPTLRWREGDTVTIRVTNRLPVETSIHWHGILLPDAMDGVPGVTYPGIAPGGTFVYRFEVKQSGTFWYHSHTRFQEQTGLYGPIVIEPRTPNPFSYDRDYVVMLSDWTDEDPEEVFEHLKQMSDYYNYVQPTAGSFIERAKREGFAQAWHHRMLWNQMRMTPRDLSDASGATYTFLTNGRTPAANWTGLFKPRERVRLRFINGSSMTYFDVRIPGLTMTVVAADGQNVHPVTVDEFRVGVAETYDVIVQPMDDQAYTIFAQAFDRSGYARGTLAPRVGMQASIPPVDPVPELTLADMGMDMSAMKGMSGMSGMSMGGMSMAGVDGMTAADGMGNRAGMDLGHQASNGSSPQGGEVPVRYHYPTEYGPGNTTRLSSVSTRLDDPGVGLRNNGRRVLTYADLHTLGGPLDPREPTREILLHLTGNMDRYIWSFNGVPFSDSKPLKFNHGERLRVVLVNETMMNHPIHLHGMWSEMESPDARFQVRKHTITVQPAHRITYRVSADALGNWAYHCHLLYHMQAGMFRVVVVS